MFTSPQVNKPLRQSLNKPVPKSLDGRFEVGVVARLPIRRGTRNGFIAGERNIEHVGRVVTVVTIHYLTVTGRS